MNETAAETEYLIVSQFKSNRVVYFTDDLSYVPPQEGDWFYLSLYRGPLPEGLKLNNCWGWRFNGSEWIDARGKKNDVRTPEQALLENNRQNLLKMLNEKVDSVRAPFLAKNYHGNEIRNRKLAEAQDYLREPGAAEAYPYLQVVASARGLSLHAAAELLADSARQTEQVLLESETWREKLSVEISTAQTAQVLETLREVLLEDMYPALSEKFAVKHNFTTQKEQNRPLNAGELRHEQIRLRVLLREKINRLRRHWKSDYLFDDLLTEQKVKQARLVKTGSTALLENAKLALLDSLAQAQGTSREEVATQVLREYEEMSALLEETELMNDRGLMAIAGVKAASDIEEFINQNLN